MISRFYIDTNIWMDYAENRVSGLIPAGEFAFQFLRNCGEKNNPLVYSSLVETELLCHYSKARVDALIYTFREILEKVNYTPAQFLEAQRLARIIHESHRSDILHAILARDANCVIITRDKGFEYLREIVAVAKPEEIYFK